MSQRSGVARSHDGPAAYPMDGGGDGYARGATSPGYSRDNSPRDKIGRYRGRGGGDRAAASGGGGGGGGLHVNLNVEQMVSMVFELRGTLAHEVEARRSVEAQLHETRLSIESLREVSSRDNNKWTNLLGRVKELEVASKLDTRLVDLNSRADKFSRQADASKIVSVFQEMRARMDAAEREYRDTIARMVRDQQRDHARMDTEMRNFMEANMGKVEQRMASETDGAARIAARVQQLEKEFAVFMNTQMQMQMNAAHKEKDGDWLKIYLTENFNAQKAATEIKFAEVGAQVERVQDQTRALEDRIAVDVAARLADVHESVAEERVSRDNAVKKLSKSLKLSFTSLGENLKGGVGGLDAKFEASKRAQNEAISNLHALVLSEQRKLEQHQAVFNDLMGVQAEQTSKEHNLRTRMDGLEEVLKAEIKSRIKNYQKHKLASMDAQKSLEGKLAHLESFVHAADATRTRAENEQRAAEREQRAEEEEQARLLHLAMETRSVLDSMVGQVEEQHNGEMRRHEWKAFGAVIELELRARDEEMDRKLATLTGGAEGDPTSLRGEVSSLRHYVESAFSEFHAHDRASRAEEEEQAQMLSIAMEARSVLDGVVTHIVDRGEEEQRAGIVAHVRAIDAHQHEVERQLLTLQTQMVQLQDASASQLGHTQSELIRMAQGLAAQVDSHSAHLEDLSKVQASQSKDLSLLRSQGEDAADVAAMQGRDVKNLKSSLLDVQDTIAAQQSQVKSLQVALSDASMQAAQLRNEIDIKLSSRAHDVAASAASSSSQRADELSALLKRLDGVDRAQSELQHTADTLVVRQSKLDQSLLAMQSSSDEVSVAADRRAREARERLEAALEDNEIAIKKIDKKLLAHMDEFDKLQSEVATSKSGAVAAAVAASGAAVVSSSSSSKHVEDAVLDLRSKLASLSDVGGKLDACRAEVRDLSARVDSSQSAERHARDFKDLLSKLQGAEEAQAKDAKGAREAVKEMEEAHARQHKATMERLAELEGRVLQLRSGSNASSSDSLASSSSSKRVVDASLVEKEVRGLQDELTTLTRRLKEQSNAQEDALNRVAQDLKRMTIQVDAIEAGAAAAVPKHADHLAGGGGGGGKDVSELVARVGQLESELKLKSLPALTLQVETLQSKTETRLAEHADKLAALDVRLDKQDLDIRGAAAAAEDTDAKQNRRVKELAQQLEAQSARDTDAINQLKQSVNQRSLEAGEALKAAESRSHGQVRDLQRLLDAHELSLKSHARAVDDKLHAMEWSLEYAKDEHFKKDAKQIRAGAQAQTAHKQTPAPPRQQSASRRDAAPPPPSPPAAAAPQSDAAASASADEPSDNYTEDSRSKVDAANEADTQPNEA